MMHQNHTPRWLARLNSLVLAAALIGLLATGIVKCTPI